MNAADDTPPEPKRILFNDTRTGESFVMQVPPTSPWHDLLPEHQECDIKARA